MDELLGLSAAAISGGAFGVAGTALGRVIGFFERRETHAQERARWDHEVRLHELQIKAGAAETERELAVLAASGSYEGLSASLAADAKLSGGYRWVDAVRALVRPVLTPFLWLVYLVVLLAVLSGGRNGGSAEAAGLVGDFVANVAFAATAATLWWFGDRAPRTPKD